MSEGTFQFAQVHRRTTELQERLREILVSSKDKKIKKLQNELVGLGVEGPDGSRKPPLTVAMVGQYDAGKSTMISALTGRTDISIDADVCTDEVTAYDWDGVQLLDTPGIHAGYPDHDERTYAAMDRSDLLVFTITNELFDDIVGQHFRSLAFDRNKAREMMLVVNKMGQDSGGPEVKKNDLLKVIAPLALEDCRTVFIDAQAYLEAREESDENDRADLQEIANFSSFTQALDGFVRDRGLIGRLTTPLFGLRTVAEQARSYASVKFPEERAALELLFRKRRILHESKSRLQSQMTGLVDTACSKISELGDGVAENIDPGSSKEKVEKAHRRAQEKAKARCETLIHEGAECILGEMQLVRGELDALGKGPVSQSLKGRMAGILNATKTPKQDNPAGKIQWGQATGPSLEEWPAQAERIGKVAREIGTYATQSATGPLAEGAKLGSVTASKGSFAHQGVYHVGKFFGVQFKPWGAVNVARHIGNAGRVVGAVGGILGLVAQIAEERQLEKQRKKLRGARESVRDAYSGATHEVRKSFLDRFTEFENTFYGNELAQLDQIESGLVQRRETRSEEASRLIPLCRELTLLIDEVQAF